MNRRICKGVVRIANVLLLCSIGASAWSGEPNMTVNIQAVKLGEPVMDMTSHGDVWEAAWADDGHLYVTSDDSRGFKNQPGRNLQFHILRGNAPSNLVGETLNLMDEYGGMTASGPDKCMWKANGNTCVGGNIYVFVSRHGLDFKTRQSAANSSAIVSTDKGKTWRRSAKENFEKPMFPGPRFGSPFFVKYGQDGAAAVHQADRYIYAISNNGFWENGDDMILGRVSREKIARLDPSDWQFFTGGDGMEDKNWSTQIADAKPILSNPGKCSMTGAQYVEPLKRYLMIQWYYTSGTGHVASSDTTWIFLESPAPWGPWREIGTQRFKPQGYYNPCIVSKFISSDGRRLTIFTNGDFRTAFASGEKCLYRLTQIPCELEFDWRPAGQ